MKDENICLSQRDANTLQDCQHETYNDNPIAQLDSNDNKSLLECYDKIDSFIIKKEYNDSERS